MKLTLLRPLLAVALLVAALAIAACGGDDEGGSGSGSGSGGGGAIEELTKGTATENDPSEGKRGGKVTMLSDGDVDYIDPGQTYYSYTLGIMDALHRKLYTYEPNNPEKPTPDLAEGDPEISEDGKTVTIKIRRGVKFSEPVNREVTTKDVKYAIERTFSSHLANGYQMSYFKDIVGAPSELEDEVPEIEGIETPDDQTIVFRLKRASGRIVAGAMALPASVPVPEEYARKFDAKSPTTYGQNQVFTGPYMIEHNDKGNLTGYKANRFIKIVRNPQYVKAGDFRPAYLDAIEISSGNDPNVAFRRILSGSKLISGDGGAPPTILRNALRSNKPQVSMKPSGGVRWVSMDTSRKPFDDINVRKAVIAGFDRNALRQQRGGPAIGPIAQGYIPPGLPGFDESGGEKGFGFDFMAKPQGDKALMASYFKKAGFASGKYEGDEEVLLVGDRADPDKSIAESVDRQLRQMGFKTKLRTVTRETMFTRFCQRPKAEQHMCPSVGWLKDFADPQTMLQVTFGGDAINDANNNNWSELDVDAIDTAMERAELINDPEERAKAWADINKQIVAQAPAIPYVWDYENNMGSKDVKLIQNQFSTLVDLSFTSIK